MLFGHIERRNNHEVASERTPASIGGSTFTKYPPTSINDFLTQAPIILNTKNRIWYSANGTDPWYSAEFNFVTKKAKELHIKY